MVAVCDGMRMGVEMGFGIGQWELVIWGNVGRATVTNGDFAERHGPVPKLLWADYVPIVYHFSDIAKYWSKTASLSHSTCIWRTHYRVDPNGI